MPKKRTQEEHEYFADLARKILREYDAEDGPTQAELGKKYGYSTATINRWIHDAYTTREAYREAREL